MVKSCIACPNVQSKSSTLTFHRLPVNKEKRHIWLKRLNRLDLKDCSHRVVCALHFTASSFLGNTSIKKNVNDIHRTRNRLKSEAIPTESIGIIDINTDSRSITTQTDIDLTSLSDLFEKLSLFQNNIINTTICIERFRNDDTNIKYYTGFRSYAVFKMVFELLESHYDEYFVGYPLRTESIVQYSKSSTIYNLSKENQFFLFMVRLRRATEEHELGIFFNISQTTVSRIVIAWTRFIYSVVSSISLWQSKEQIQNTLPFEIKKNYPAVRVIVDCTEFKIEQPTNPQAQQDTWSTYKNTNTAKGLVGITPNGIVSFISPLFGGATSDRALLNMEGPDSLLQLLEDGDQIMSDRGFALDQKHSKFLLIHPPFLERRSQLSFEKVIETRIIARHRIHVERCMGRIKNFKLLNGIIPQKSIYLLNFWFYICTFFTIFDKPLVQII
ncbi:unnamed protein product [Rotaria socialis]|uniref:THAP-type domain-containing protein n=1 Tax=Rotaria socialis TaxID=392032 RepID=A0A821SLP2_9BILA|nr:unnamed protein product [Rotaria socialis]CAF4859950.1 unnamed protein product [Rotaria socialis]